MFLRKINLRQDGWDYTYLKVVENVRKNGRPVQKTLVNLGNVAGWPPERLGKLVCILSRFLGRPASGDGIGDALKGVRLSDCRQLGPYLPLAQLWDRLGVDGVLASVLGGRKLDPGVIACIKAMVLTRLVSPRSPAGRYGSFWRSGPRSPAWRDASCRCTFTTGRSPFCPK